MKTISTNFRFLISTVMFVVLTFVVPSQVAFASIQMSSSSFSVSGGSAISSGYIIGGSSESYISKENILNAILALSPIPASSPSTSSGGGGGGFIMSNTACTSVVIVDINCDLHVDLLDFNLIMVFWGQVGINIKADLNRDGVVDLFDFNLLMVNWTG